MKERNKCDRNIQIMVSTPDLEENPLLRSIMTALLDKNDSKINNEVSKNGPTLPCSDTDVHLRLTVCMTLHKK